MAAPLAVPKPNRVLFGREVILSDVCGNIDLECTLFALEGLTGIGKSALLFEISDRLVRTGFSGVVNLNAAQCTSEDLAIAAVYVQLRQLARDPVKLAEELKKRFTSDLPKTLWKLGGAVAADLLKLATDKAEKTVEVIKETISGKDAPPSVASELSALDGDDRRYFIGEFLKAIADAHNRVVIAVDNFDSADVTLVSFFRFLVKEKPDSLILILAQNSEVGDNRNWDNLLADLRAHGGRRFEVLPLDADAVSAWFHSEIGRAPSPIELDALLQQTHGRAQDVKLAIDEMKDGKPRSRSDYSGYYERARRLLSSDGRTVAELLAIIKRDTLITEELLAVAADKLGITNLSPALDELRDLRLLKEDSGFVGFSHSQAHVSWLQTINAHRKEQLGRAWFSAVKGYDVSRLASPELAGLIPVIATPLLENRSRLEITETSARLIAIGQTRIGLELLDRSWQFKPENDNKGPDMLRSALIAARTRLELGRYRDVDEPLAQAEMAAGDDAMAKIQILLLRMKLALRRNAYPVLRSLAAQLQRQGAANREAQIEGELILNSAYRDLLDMDALRASSEQLVALRPTSTAAHQNAIDRALARSFAKLGDVDRALDHAENAVATSRDLDSIRTVGNAKLALAEVRRYRREFDQAIVAYRGAAAFARASGNRDSQLWSLLGEAAAHIEANTREKASEPLDEVRALLAEPGYTHPLETAHASLLRALADLETLTEDQIAKLYSPFQMGWPVKHLEAFRTSGKVNGPTPL
jgi:tetratricopeptide (TPR) repeat protein